MSTEIIRQMSTEIIRQLSEPFAPEMERTMSKGGTRLTYIPVSEVINRLNKVLGVDKWSFEIMSCLRDAIDPDYVVAHVRLTWNPDEHAYVQRDGFGGQKIKRTKQGDIVDLGDEMKGAVSDALKKAAQTLGVGLYLARSDEAMDIEEAMESSALQPEIDTELLSKWDKFTSIVKSFTDDQKATLNTFWSESSGGKPKPTKATATHEMLDALIGEAVRISFGGEYATPGN
jgi:recombination DNA repair RAD52 pathway protein